MKKNFLIALLPLVAACSKNADPLPAPADTILKLTVFDRTVSTNAAGATVKLYASLADWQYQTNVLAVKTADPTGQVSFTGLSNRVYWWYAESGCRTNWYESNSTSVAIPGSTTTSLTTAISSTGTLRFINNFANACRIDVNGITVIASLPPGTYNLPMGAGVHNIRVVRLSGGTFDQTYSGTLSCGGVLATTFP